jgi:hypothetical protein
VADHAQMRLGKQAPKYDPRSLRLARYLATDLPPPPDELDLVSKVDVKFGMYLNDQLGDCTCASLAHAIQFWSAANGHPVDPLNDDVLTAYENACGYDPADPDTDRGGIMLNVANYFRRTGIAGQKADAWVALDPKNEKLLKYALAWFGGAWVGVNLPVSAQVQPSWYLALGGGDGDPTPGSWGGHSIFILPKYDRAGLWCVTWGSPKFLTWDWWEACNDEGYAFLSRLWADADGAPNGLMYDDLMSDLAMVRA